MVALWSVRLTPERAAQVQALAGDSVLCSVARLACEQAHIGNRATKPRDEKVSPL